MLIDDILDDITVISVFLLDVILINIKMKEEIVWAGLALFVSFSK